MGLKVLSPLLYGNFIMKNSISPGILCDLLSTFDSIDKDNLLVFYLYSALFHKDSQAALWAKLHDFGVDLRF